MKFSSIIATVMIVAGCSSFRGNHYEVIQSNNDQTAPDILVLRLRDGEGPNVTAVWSRSATSEQWIPLDAWSGSGILPSVIAGAAVVGAAHELKEADWGTRVSSQGGNSASNTKQYQAQGQGQSINIKRRWRH